MLRKCHNLRNLSFIGETGVDLPTIFSVPHRKLQNVNIEHNKLREWKLFEPFDDFALRNVFEINISSTCLPIENLISLLLIRGGNFGIIAKNNNLYVKIIKKNSNILLTTIIKKSILNLFNFYNNLIFNNV